MEILHNNVCYRLWIEQCVYELILFATNKNPQINDNATTPSAYPSLYYKHRYQMRILTRQKKKKTNTQIIRIVSRARAVSYFDFNAFAWCII